MTRLADFVRGRSMAELYDTYWVPACLDAYARELAEWVSPGDRVLDLACGTGLVTGYAARRAGPNGSVVGCDPTPDFLNAAREKTFAGAAVELIEGFGEDLPFEAATFDVVLCSQGLQYVTDRKKVFEELRRVLKPGGRVHASVWSSAEHQPHFGFMEDALSRHFGNDQKPIHAWSFGGLDELRRLAEGTGFQITRLENKQLPARFESIQALVDIQIACAGRTDEDGLLAMGIIDLDDESLLPAIEAFASDARRVLSEFESDEGLVAIFASDEISCTA